MNLKPSKSLVLIDAGHGIDTPEKRSPVWKDGTQLFEWKFNREIASFFMGYLHLAGISYISIVTEQEDIPLKERVHRINSYFTKYSKLYPYIYGVSIHGNWFKDPKTNGIEVFSCMADNESDVIAKEYYNALSKLGWRMRKGDRCVGKEANFYILREDRVKCPMVLTESGFYSNEEECKKMMDFYWKKKIAHAHFKAAWDIERRLHA